MNHLISGHILPMCSGRTGSKHLLGSSHTTSGFLRQLRLKFLFLTWDNGIFTLVVNCLCPQRAFAATHGSTVRIKGVISCLHSLSPFFFCFIVNGDWVHYSNLVFSLKSVVYREAFGSLGLTPIKPYYHMFQGINFSCQLGSTVFKALAALVFLLLRSGLFFFQLRLFLPLFLISSNAQFQAGSLSLFH